MGLRFRKTAIPILNLAYYSGLYRMLGSVYGGCGLIFSLHRVMEPGRPTLIYPNFMIHAHILDDILGTVRRLGWELVSIDEVYRRLVDSKPVLGRGNWPRRFACFTCDDGYADNLTVALPVFRKHQAPLCVYIASGFLERSAFYWWGASEELVFKSDRIDLPPVANSGPRTLWARTLEEKLKSFQALTDLCHKQGEQFYPELRQIFQEHGVDAQRSLDRDALTAAQVRELAADPLVTIGCHGVRHERLSRMTAKEVCLEMEEGRRKLEDWLGVEVRHLAYPFGRSDACGPREFALAQQLGFKTAVTTRQGNIFPQHRHYLHCLPRRSVPLNRVQLRNILFGVQTILHNDRRFQTD
jgi:peptidoglycan/xylan/chitin deacetylase (PgdA/CDA1 family)